MFCLVENRFNETEFRQFSDNFQLTKLTQAASNRLRRNRTTVRGASRVPSLKPAITDRRLPQRPPPPTTLHRTTLRAVPPTQPNSNWNNSTICAKLYSARTVGVDTSIRTLCGISPLVRNRQ